MNRISKSRKTGSLEDSCEKYNTNEEGFLLSSLLATSQIGPGSVELLCDTYVSNRQTNATYVLSVINVC